jgi:hypothetical protein
MTFSLKNTSETRIPSRIYILYKFTRPRPSLRPSRVSRHVLGNLARYRIVLLLRFLHAFVDLLEEHLGNPNAFKNSYIAVLHKFTQPRPSLRPSRHALGNLTRYRIVLLLRFLHAFVDLLEEHLRNPNTFKNLYITQASAKKTISYMALVDHIFVHKVNIGLVQPYMPFYGLAQPYIPLYGQVQNHILVNKKCNVIYYV